MNIFCIGCTADLRCVSQILDSHYFDFGHIR